MFPRCPSICGSIAKKGNRKHVMLTLIFIQICLIGVYYKSLSQFTIKEQFSQEPTKYFNKNNSAHLENEHLLSRITDLESNVIELRSFIFKIQNEKSNPNGAQKLKQAFSFDNDKHSDKENIEDYYDAQRAKKQKDKYHLMKKLKESRNLKYDFNDAIQQNQYGVSADKYQLSESNIDQYNRENNIGGGIFYGDNFGEKNYPESENIAANYDVLASEDIDEDKEEDYEANNHKCRKKPKALKGIRYINFEELPEVIPYEVIEKQNQMVSNGGQYTPPDCLPRWKVAIIIPYRNRERHLQIFLYFMHPILQRHLIHYRIYIINQAGNEKFNRAKLLNVGYTEALKDENFDCFVFHDVDHILINDKALYTCPPSPRHLSHSLDKFNWGLPYENMFGGVSQLTREQFSHVNGFSNTFWGWGGEDDDMRIRIEKMGYQIIRYPIDIAVYMAIPHLRDKGNEDNPAKESKLYETTYMMATDGLSSLNYTVMKRDVHTLYTNITVDIGLCGNDCVKPKRNYQRFNNKFNMDVQQFGNRLAKLSQQLEAAGISLPNNRLFHQQNRRPLENHATPQQFLPQNNFIEQKYQKPIQLTNEQYQQLHNLEQS